MFFTKKHRLKFSYFSMTFIFLDGCSDPVQLPKVQREIRLCGSVEKKIKVVSDIAKEKGVDLSYGTNPADFEGQVTFRLFGEGYEVLLYNFEKNDLFELHLYEDGNDNSASDAALRKTESIYRAIASSVFLKCGVE